MNDLPFTADKIKPQKQQQQQQRKQRNHHDCRVHGLPSAAQLSFNASTTTTNNVNIRKLLKKWPVNYCKQNRKRQKQKQQQQKQHTAQPIDRHLNTHVQHPLHPVLPDLLLLGLQLQLPELLQSVGSPALVLLSRLL